MYTLTFAPQALEDLAKLKKSEPAAFKKAGKLLGELQDHTKLLAREARANLVYLYFRKYG